MQLGASAQPWGLSPLCYVYWGALTALGLFLLASGRLLVRRVLRPWESRFTKPSRQGDPDAALVDALHLLDALMEKIWRRLQQMERKRRERRDPDTGWS